MNLNEYMTNCFAIIMMFLAIVIGLTFLIGCVFTNLLYEKNEDGTTKIEKGEKFIKWNVIFIIYGVLLFIGIIASYIIYRKYYMPKMKINDDMCYSYAVKARTDYRNLVDDYKKGHGINDEEKMYKDTNFLENMDKLVKEYKKYSADYCQDEYDRKELLEFVNSLEEIRLSKIKNIISQEKLNRDYENVDIPDDFMESLEKSN